jgi:hypothetical protein
MGEFLDRLRIDRRDRGGERDALRGERQAQALRHVAVLARDGDPGKAAPLDLARDVEGGAPLPRRGDEIECGQLWGHRYLTIAGFGLGGLKLQSIILFLPQLISPATPAAD